MTKLALLGVAVVASYAALATPAFAQHRHASPAVIAATEGGWCPNREAGNPYTKEEDYIAWSSWRSRGSWDDHNDFNCGPVRYSRHGF
jgi:hypothetical protein